MKGRGRKRGRRGEERKEVTDELGKGAMYERGERKMGTRGERKGEEWREERDNRPIRGG